MAISVKDEFNVDKLTLVADARYDSASDISKCISNNIAPHISNINNEDYEIYIETEENQSEEILSYENGRSVYLKERNIGICPMGKVLYPSYYRKDRGVAVFYGGIICHACSEKCTKEKSKKLEITIPKKEFSKEYNDSNLFIKKIKVERDKELLKQRKCIVEHPFGILKRHMDFDHVLLKGKENVSGEFSLAYLALNLKRAINIIGTKKLIRALQM